VINGLSIQEMSFQRNKHLEFLIWTLGQDSICWNISALLWSRTNLETSSYSNVSKMNKLSTYWCPVNVMDSCLVTIWKHIQESFCPCITSWTKSIYLVILPTNATTQSLETYPFILWLFYMYIIQIWQIYFCEKCLLYLDNFALLMYVPGYSTVEHDYM